MKNKQILFALLMLMVCLSGFSQNTELSVFSKTTNEPLPYTHIRCQYLKSEKPFLIFTDLKGKVTIEKKQFKKVALQLSFLGYQTIQDTLILGKNKTYFLKEDFSSIGEIVVIGQYSPNLAEDAIQKVTIIDHKKIEKMAAVNLKDVLSNQMNVRLSQDNILGSGMSMQGMSGENVKILVDGIPVIGRLNGNVDLSQINLNDVERIEIVEGPMSVNYGTNALAGVINLISKKNKTEKIALITNTYYENIGQYNLDGMLSTSFKKHSISFSGGRNYFDGWVDGDHLFKEGTKIADTTRFKSWKPKEQYFIKTKYNYQLKNGNLKYSLGYFKEKINNLGMPRLPYLETALDDYYYTYRTDNALSFNKKMNKTKNIQAIFAYNNYRRIKNTYFKDLTTLEKTQTTNLGNQDTSKFNQWLIRSSFSTSKDSVKINYQIGIDFNLEQAYGSRIENKTKKMGDYAFYSSLEYLPFKNTAIRPGLRYAYNTNYQAPLTPSLNIKQTIGKFNLRASYARGFRAPSLKELYFNFVDINHNIVGNTDLKAERSHNVNLSVHYKKPIEKYTLKINTSLFYNRINNLITLAQNQGSAAQFSYVNIGDFQTHGIQLNTKISYTHFSAGLGSSYTGRYNYLSKENKSVTPFSYTPEINGNINYEFPKQQLFFAGFYKYTGKLPSFGISKDNEIQQNYIGSYHTADCSIGKYFLKKQLQVTLGSKNIFNVKNVSAVTQGSVHSGSSGSSPVAMGRTYFLKMTLKPKYENKK